MTESEGLHQILVLVVLKSLLEQHLHCQMWIWTIHMQEISREQSQEVSIHREMMKQRKMIQFKLLTIPMLSASFGAVSTVTLQRMAPMQDLMLILAQWTKNRLI